MSSRILALDIREAGACAVMIRTGLKESRLERHVYVDFADAPDPEHSLEWAVEKAVAASGAAGAYSLVSIPPSCVSFRNITVPFKSRKKIKQILAFELEPTLPFEIDKVILDFMTVGQQDQTDLIAAAVEKQRLEHILHVLDQNGIYPGYVTTGGLSQALCVAGGSDSGLKNFIFVDNDRSSATVCIAVSGKICLMRTLRKTVRAGDHVASAKELCAGIRRMISAFETIYDMEFEPEKLLISGLDANAPDFVSSLENTLEIGASCLDLQADTDLNIIFPEGPEPGPEATGALCLAGVETAGIRPFNFGRRHSAVEKYWSENRGRIITTGVLCLLVFILFMSRVATEVHFLEKQISAIDSAILEQYRSTFPGEQRIVDPLKQMRGKLGRTEGEEGFADQAGSEVLNIDILYDISRLIPEGTDVVITRFVRDSEGIQISGLSSNFNTVDDVKVHLESSQYLSNLSISSANMDKRAEKVRFRIKADLTGAGQ
ncbi:MAG: PilN domain-containing protein [Desulfobacteraceae bacterium]|nr:PilN domain-containing protein [Desulfobacteraceae bacterium]